MEQAPAAAQTPSGRPLGAAMAVVAFLSYFMGQIAASFIVLIPAMVLAAKEGVDLSGPGVTDEIVAEWMPVLAVLSMVGGFLGMGFGAFLVRGALKDRSSFGAAWVLGPPKAWLTSALMGAALSGTIFLLTMVYPAPEDGGAFSQMASEPGLGRFVWVFIAVALAPPLEELLFRGVMFGGLARRLGISWSIAITTVVFVLLHVSEAIYYWPAFLYLTALSLLAVRQRLRHEAIGPAVALHMGYNGLLAGATLFS